MNDQAPSPTRPSRPSRPTRPTRQRPRPRTAGMVHIGPGAFFRALVARYTEEACSTPEGGAPHPWGIRGVSLRSSQVRDALAGQDFVYTAHERQAGGRVVATIEALTDILVAPEDPGAVVDALADPAVKIVSLTVTEKAYADSGPGSAVAFLVEGLARRHAAGGRPFTALSCDNLNDNGAVLRAAVLAAAGERDAALTDWIVREGRFPCTMVDRITPATTAADIAAYAAETGVYDPGLVVHEPFRQWVIEDAFVDGERPDWAAQFVEDVAPFELMKLRLLNGAHTALAVLGLERGFSTVAEAVGDPALRAFIQGLWAEEMIPTLRPLPASQDLEAYCAALLTRFENPAMEHQLAQIALDMAQKIEVRIKAPLAERRAAGLPSPRLEQVLAGVGAGAGP